MLPLLAVLLLGAACDSASPGGEIDRNDLDSMDRCVMLIGNQGFEVWLARTAEERALGLMHVEASELAPAPGGAIRGMLFLFPDDAPRRFWMKDTPTALDLAYIASDHTIVRIHTMTPFDTSAYPSGQPARFALEVLADTFADLGVQEGDLVTLPPECL
jgi:uncharacterized membrane protein (UPF0127 family)